MPLPGPVAPRDNSHSQLAKGQQGQPVCLHQDLSIPVAERVDGGMSRVLHFIFGAAELPDGLR
jgi:hypothetical protein